MKSLDESVFAIVGLGLMGGSLALALREENARKEILGIDHDAEARALALERGVVNSASADLSLAAQADIIVLATPVHTILRQLPRAGALARAGAVVIDLGSTKREIIAAMESLPAQIQCIGGHPMCGRETSGFRAADANLFRDAVFVLTPLARTSAQTIALAKSLVETIGAHALVLDAAQHDKIVAAVSHLPYALAVALTLTADELARADDLLFTLAASGFRDTTRLAASDPTMMLDILLTNRINVANLMRGYSRRLDELADLVADGNESALRPILESTALRRRELFQ